jgi:uncharacterized membrane protein
MKILLKKALMSFALTLSIGVFFAFLMWVYLNAGTGLLED